MTTPLTPLVAAGDDTKGEVMSDEKQPAVALTGLSEGLGPCWRNEMTPEDQGRLAADEDSAEERHCYQMLAELRKSYERDAKPYIDRLVAIKSMRAAPSITLTMDQARELVDFTMSARDGA